MSVKKTIFREQESVGYVPNSSVSAKLQRNYDYSHIWMELTVNYKATNSSTFKYLHFANLIKSFQIFGNGSTEFKNQAFAQLFYQTYIYTRGRLPFGIPEIGTDEYEETFSYKMRFLVPFASLLMTKPSDTGLRSSQFQTLDYMITWADSSVVGTDIEITSAQLKPVSWERIETLTEGEAQPSNSRLIQKIQTEQITSSASGILINLPPNKIYNDIFIDLINGTTGDAVEGAIKKIKFLNGTDVITQVDFDMLKVENQRRYDIDDELFCRVYKNEIVSNQIINPKAHAVLNFSAVGHYMSSLSLGAMNQPQLSLDIDLPKGVTSLAVRLCENYVE